MTSLLEKIAEDVQTTLAGVTADEYGYTLAVERARKKSEPDHLKAIIYQTNKHSVEPKESTADEKTAEFTVLVYILPPNDTDEYDSINNQVADACEAQLMQDVTRGGLATNTVMGDTTIYPAENGEFGGFTLVFTVHYRHPFGQPLVAGSGGSGS